MDTLPNRHSSLTALRAGLGGLLLWAAPATLVPDLSAQSTDAAVPLIRHIPGAEPSMPTSPASRTASPQWPQPGGVDAPAGKDSGPALQTVLLGSSPEQLQRMDRSGEGVRAESVELLASPDGQLFLRELAKDYLGRPTGPKMVAALEAAVIDFYQRQERPMVFVQAAGQGGGAVALLVVESRLGTVRVEGAQWFSAERLQSMVRLEPGQPIHRSQLLEDVDWINRNPFRQTDLVLEPGAEPGTTDIVLPTQDRRPWRVHTTLDNTGSESTGEWRSTTGVNWGNAFGLDHILSYQYSTPVEDFAEYENVHSLDWIMPLDWRHQLNVFAAYTDSEVALGGGATYEGEAIQASGRYLIPLTPFTEGLFHELTLGVDYKRSDFGFILGSQQIPTNLTEILQFSIQYSGGLADEHGQTAFGLGFVYSPGNLLGLNGDKDFRQVDPRASAEYAYTTVYLRRTQSLPKGWSMFGQVNAQHTDDVLLTSEQVSIGGYGSVRGYQERVLLGDEGAWASLELRSPAVSTPLSRHLRVASTDQLQGILFLDAGWVRSTESLAGEPSSYHIWSVGTGLRYQLGSHISLRADLGLPLKETELKLDRSARLHFGITASF